MNMWVRSLLNLAIALWYLQEWKSRCRYCILPAGGIHHHLDTNFPWPIKCFICLKAGMFKVRFSVFVVSIGHHIWHIVIAGPILRLHRWVRSLLPDTDLQLSYQLSMLSENKTNDADVWTKGICSKPYCLFIGFSCLTQSMWPYSRSVASEAQHRHSTIWCGCVVHKGADWCFCSFSNVMVSRHGQVL